MIICVTPNPAIDHTLTVPHLLPNQVMRAIGTRTAAGGKGLNVARAIRVLGGDVMCLGFVGGHNGERLAALAESEGLAAKWTWTTQDTRTCIIIVNKDDGQTTVINEPGPHVTD